MNFKAWWKTFRMWKELRTSLSSGRGGRKRFSLSTRLNIQWRHRYRSAMIYFLSLFISLCLYILGWIEVVPWWTIPRFCNSFPALPKGLRWLATHTSDMCLKNIKVHYLTSMLVRQPERERERERQFIFWKSNKTLKIPKMWAK